MEIKKKDKITNSSIKRVNHKYRETIMVFLCFAIRPNKIGSMNLQNLNPRKIKIKNRIKLKIISN